MLLRLVGIILLLVDLCAGGLFSKPAFAQTGRVQPRITQALDESQLTTLRGNVHPLARAEFDRGPAPPDLPMQRMLLVLKRGAEQETALQKLLDDQQDKASPNFHKWLTPEEFGQQFGPADEDLQTVTAWLQSHGFQVARISKGRTVIEFSGAAAQVQEAFHTAIHKFTVNGEEHWANANDPQIPAALTPVVAGVNTLHNFPRRPMMVNEGVVSRSKATGQITSAQPLFTLPASRGCGFQTSNCFALGPYDFATIYNVLPLWTSSPTAINGTGETIAIVGDSDVNPQDVTDFRNFFGLPAANFQTVNDGPDPGTMGAETEAALDVEWSGAVAPGANIILVVAEDTETALGVDLAAQHIIDNNLAPILSESWGVCELGLGTAGNQFFNQLWQQASAQGITVLIASGDSGSAVCDSHSARPPAPAKFGLAVSGFASTPYNTTVGGTDFFDLTNASAYWNTSNASPTQASAKSYIPETTWNDSCTNSSLGLLSGYSTNAETNCNMSILAAYDVFTLGGSGGKSTCTTSNGQTLASCAGGYSKPSWQTALTPADGKRDVPDVSLFAATGRFSGSFYIICEADQIQSGTSCNPNDSSTQFLAAGGTSASTPAMAGIMALVEQKIGGRLGNANYVLYKLAGQQTPANCNSSNGSGGTCVFNDVTSGTIAMPCAKGSPNCTTNVGTDQYGVLSGYSATTSYDLATGLGSVNAANLVTKWAAVTLTPSVATLTSLTPTTITHGQTVNFDISVAPQSGSGTPTGTVSLETSLASNGDGVGSAVLSAGNAAGTTAGLPGGTYNVTAHYPGDGTFASSDSSPVSVTVNKENSATHVELAVANYSNGQFTGITDTTTATYGSAYLLRGNVTGTACSSNSVGQVGCPTGTVTVTDSGAPLDGGIFALNTSGYMEDQEAELAVGTHPIQVQYGGDNSFNASSGSASISITPAPTTVTKPAMNPQEAGVPVAITATVQTQSSGVAPTGMVMFSANGNPLTGTYSSTGSAASSTGPASLTATLSTTFPASGNEPIAATYGGDANYSGSTSPVLALNLLFAPPALLLNLPNPASVSPGQNVTLTAFVDTQSKTVAPTGTVQFLNFIDNNALPGTVTYTPTTDANGYQELEASMTFQPTATLNISATYGGDSNYPQAQGNRYVSVSVTGSDFSVFVSQPAQISISSPGGQGGLQLVIGAQSDYTGTINFGPASCTGLPPESTCSFGPATIIGGGTTQLTVSTTGPHQLTLRGPVVSHSRGWWTSSLGLGAAGIFLLGLPCRRRRSRLFSLFVLALLITLPSCGGGGGGGGGGGTTDPGTPTGTYTVTVTATSGSLSHSTTFQLAVQ